MFYKSLGQLLNPAIDSVLNPVRGPRLPLWPVFDEYLYGLRPHELTLLCAPTGAGKTAWMANVSAQLIAQSIPHFVAPVETGDIDYSLRVVSILTQKDLNSGEAITHLEAAKIIETISPLQQINQMYISTQDNRVPIDEMIATLQFMSDLGCKVALLDNLNFFLNVVSSSLEKAEMDSAIHEFVILAKRIPMHIILIVHPRKTDGGRVESEFDIKGSSTAVQEAANVILFNRPTQKDIENCIHSWSERELVFKKIRRRGRFVNKPIWYDFVHGQYVEKAPK